MSSSAHRYPHHFEAGHEADHRLLEQDTAEMARGNHGPYRVGNHYGIHVYSDDRPVATFFDADEAAAFVAAMNGATA